MALNMLLIMIVTLVMVRVGSLSGIFFSIDHHSLLIVEADGVSVEPRRVDKVFISPAQVSLFSFLFLFFFLNTVAPIVTFLQS